MQITLLESSRIMRERAVCGGAPLDLAYILVAPGYAERERGYGTGVVLCCCCSSVALCMARLAGPLGCVNFY